MTVTNDCNKWHTARPISHRYAQDPRRPHFTEHNLDSDS